MTEPTTAEVIRQAMHGNWNAATPAEREAAGEYARKAAERAEEKFKPYHRFQMIAENTRARYIALDGRFTIWADFSWAAVNLSVNGRDVLARSESAR